jgi:hypothetical protein
VFSSWRTKTKNPSMLPIWVQNTDYARTLGVLKNRHSPDGKALAALYDNTLY